MTSHEGMLEHELHIGHVVADPLGDVLEWLGHYRPKEGEDFCRKEGSVREPVLDTSEDTSPEGAGPAHTHASRSLRPKMEGQRMGLGAHGSGASSGPGRPSTSSPPAPPSFGSTAVAAAAYAAGGAAAAGAYAVKAASAAAPEASPGTASTKCCDAVGGKRGKGLCSAPERKDLVDEEEEEWEMRQRKSGTVGRLVVYGKTERPREDVVLRGGGRRHIVVAGVREGGQASRAGVRAGDRLVSIDGEKKFAGLTADTVRDNLTVPCVLVFLGFVGKLQAEVRLTASDDICGLGAKGNILCGAKDAPVQICEERIFDVGIASLFLTTDAERIAAERRAQRGRQSLLSEDQRPLFELQRSEASVLLKRVLRRVEVPEKEKTETFESEMLGLDKKVGIQQTGRAVVGAGRQTPPRPTSGANASAVTPEGFGIAKAHLSPSSPSNSSPAMPASPPPVERPLEPQDVDGVPFQHAISAKSEGSSSLASVLLLRGIHGPAVASDRLEDRVAARSSLSSSSGTVAPGSVDLLDPQASEPASAIYM